MKEPRCLKKHNPTYGQMGSNELCEVNLLFVMYIKRIVIIIAYAATNRGWHLNFNINEWSFKSLNWIVHVILLILGEIWSKGSNLTILCLVDVFAEVAEVNAEAFNIKSYQPRQKNCRDVPRKNVFSHSYLGILFAAAKNAEIWGLDILILHYNGLLSSPSASRFHQSLAKGNWQWFTFIKVRLKAVSIPYQNESPYIINLRNQKIKCKYW